MLAPGADLPEWYRHRRPAGSRCDPRCLRTAGEGLGNARLRRLFRGARRGVLSGDPRRRQSADTRLRLLPHGRSAHARSQRQDRAAYQADGRLCRAQPVHQRPRMSKSALAATVRTSSAGPGTTYKGGFHHLPERALVPRDDAPLFLGNLNGRLSHACRRRGRGPRAGPARARRDERGQGMRQVSHDVPAGAAPAVPAASWVRIHLGLTEPLRR